jgi:N-methylhydantoinase A/oxoprolinase/acetone carboxylase beta subunit
MHNYIIGIDTGGTFTDAVLLDKGDGTILATAKTPTTHYRLSEGITTALAEILRLHPAAAQQSGAVCVSSTLATNSVVENKGARVAVLVIGYVKHFKLPVRSIAYVDGGHTIDGSEEQPLDLDTLVELLADLKNEVDAYGVCAAMAMKNPTHELVAEKAIAMVDPKPVFCSHRISQQAGMQRRAATVALHARLMPVMSDFVAGVKKAMGEHRLQCPLLIVGGNGSALAAERVVGEAALTVASGPACSARFGAQQGAADCLVVDVGGTTTDIALIDGGRPQLAAEGCRIGDWLTHVEAIDMHTGAIGGDSHVHLDSFSTLHLGPGRVTPLALTGQLPSPGDWLGAEDCSRLILVRSEAVDALPANELGKLLGSANWLTPAAIRAHTGLGGIPLDRQLEELAEKEMITTSGFTPTDALHVLGKLSIGDPTAAIAGAEILGKAAGLSGRDFARKVLELAEEAIANLVLDYLGRRFWGDGFGAFLAGRAAQPALGVEFTLRLPLVGIGAAARTLLPGVAARLKTTVSFPRYGEVGNAVGAALIGLAENRPPP